MSTAIRSAAELSPSCKRGRRHYQQGKLAVRDSRGRCRAKARIVDERATLCKSAVNDKGFLAQNIFLQSDAYRSRTTCEGLAISIATRTSASELLSPVRYHRPLVETSDLLELRTVPRNHLNPLRCMPGGSPTRDVTPLQSTAPKHMAHGRLQLAQLRKKTWRANQFTTS
jgi:hypothetical protein